MALTSLAPQLHDEFETVGAGQRIPTDVLVAFLEVLGRRAPAEHGDKPGAVRLGVGAVDSLPEDVSGGSSSLEVVALVEDLAQVVDFGFLRGAAQDKMLGNQAGFDRFIFHGRLNLPKWRPVSSFFSNSLDL